MYTGRSMNAARHAALAIVCILLLSPAVCPAEIVLLADGEKLEGDVVIYYNKGLLFRENLTAPGRYYAYDEIRRIVTKDGMLWYLMPRGVKKEKKGPLAHFPLTRILLPYLKEVAPVPCLAPLRGESVQVTCAGAEDAVTIEFEGGGRTRLLGISPPPKSAGRKTARKARDYLASLVEGKMARLYPGPQSHLAADNIADAYVVVDNSLVNAGMIEHGWAAVAPQPAAHPYREAFLSLQKLAKSLRRGMWTDGAE